MVLSDFIIGPLVVIIIYLIAYIIRPMATNPLTEKFFIPALTFKLIAALALGLLYQFYYGGGDTFTYFNHGATHIHQAFLEDPSKAFRLIFLANDYQGGVYEYASKIWMYRDSASYMVVRLAGFISIFTAGSYLGTAFIFAGLSFSGLWAMYSSFVKLFPEKHFLVAVAILFIPSTVFWGSGILKDTITFGMIGWATAALIQLLYFRKRIAWFLILVASLYVVFHIKRYIVLSFVPAAIVWAFLIYMKKINNQMVKILTAPVVIALTVFFAYQAVLWVGQNDKRYAIDKLAETAKITAYDVGRWTGKNAGSRYDLGDLDGTMANMLGKAPAAINVALFRPYLWEVQNPLMLLASLEGLVLLVLTIIVIVQRVTNWGILLSSPAIMFCLIFSLIFAFAVGISTYNFGTLFRYKVPLMPFYGLFLAISWVTRSAISSVRSTKIAGQ